jgi:hypothetical protein
MGQERGVDADAVVSHGNLHAIPRFADGHVDSTARPGELHRIREQIPHHLLQPIGIAPDLPDQLPH